MKAVTVIQVDVERSHFYSFKTHIISGEIDYVKTYKDDHKNKANRDQFAGPPIVREKEAPLLLPY